MAVSSLKMLASSYKYKGRYYPQDQHLQLHRLQNLKYQYKKKIKTILPVLIMLKGIWTYEVMECEVR
jgi:hypothetical protein